MPNEAYFDMILLDQPPTKWPFSIRKNIKYDLDLLVKVTEVNLEVKVGIFVKMSIQRLTYTFSNQLFRTTLYNFDITFKTKT